MNISSLISQLTADLNDNESGHTNQTWSSADLRAWAVEGVNLVFDRRPDLFTDNVIVELDNCTIMQRVCDSCTGIRRVIGQVTESGRLIRTLKSRGISVDFSWSGKPAMRKVTPRTGTEFRLESWAVDPNSNTLYIWPEVPPGFRCWVMLECMVRPDASEIEADDYVIPDGAYVAVIQWALWRAKSIDAELSSAAMTAAQLHYKAFFECLGLATETQQIIHKKWDADK